MTQSSSTITVKTPNVMKGVYRAPEIVHQSTLFDNKIDIWAFGCILFEMITKQEAFEGEGEIRKFMAAPGTTLVLTTDYRGVDEKIATFAKSLEKLINETLEVDCNRRPTANSILKRLDRLIRTK